jgi:hypothetical protein
LLENICFCIWKVIFLRTFTSCCEISKIIYFYLKLRIILTDIGTAVVVVCVTRRSHPVDCPGCEQGMSPGGKQVWRNICQHGARELLCYRGTRRWLLDDYNG